MLSWKLLARRSWSRVVANDLRSGLFGTASQCPTAAFRLGNVACRTSDVAVRIRSVPVNLTGSQPAPIDLLYHRYRASPVQPRVEARLFRRSVTGKSLSRSDPAPFDTASLHAEIVQNRQASTRLTSPQPLAACFHCRRSRRRRSRPRLVRRDSLRTASKISSTGSDGDDPRNHGAWDEIQIVHPGAGVSVNSTRPADRTLGDQENSYKCSAAKNFRPSHVSN